MVVGTTIGEQNPPIRLLKPAVALQLFNPIARVVKREVSAADSENCSNSVMYKLSPQTRAFHYRRATTVHFSQKDCQAGYESWHVLEAFACGAHVRIPDSTRDGDLLLAELISTENTSNRKGSSFVLALSDNYQLGHRLNQIASDLKKRPVVARNADVGILTAVESTEEISRLRSKLLSLETGPTELHLLASSRLVRDAWEALEQSDGPALYVYPSDERWSLSSESVVSHLICCEPSGFLHSNVISLLKGAIVISDAEVIAIESKFDPKLPVFRYGSTEDADAVLVVRKDWINNQRTAGVTELLAKVETELYSGNISQLLVQVGPHTSTATNIGEN